MVLKLTKFNSNSPIYLQYFISFGFAKELPFPCVCIWNDLSCNIGKTGQHILIVVLLPSP